MGLPLLEDLNALDNTVGLAPQHVNIKKGIRWNMAFAYLDPIRGHERLTIMDNTLVDHLTFFEDCSSSSSNSNLSNDNKTKTKCSTPTVNGVSVYIGGKLNGEDNNHNKNNKSNKRIIRSRNIVLAAGVYGTPTILIRSGIGAKDELEALDIPIIKDLPGVGKNLHDHPALGVIYGGSPNLVKEMNSFAKE